MPSLPEKPEGVFFLQRCFKAFVQVGDVVSGGENGSSQELGSHFKKINKIKLSHNRSRGPEVATRLVQKITGRQERGRDY